MTPDDDVPNPLADVDLDVWLPPAPTAEQIEAIVQRHAGTRTDVAAALEVTSLAPTRTQRVRWLAAGILIGAAAAALIAVALWPSNLDRPTEPPPSVVAPAPAPPAPPPTLDPMPTAPPDRPGGTVASPRDFQNRARLQTLEDAAREKDWAAVGKAFEELDRDSVYYARGKELHDKLRDEFIANEVAVAKRLAERHECRTIRLRSKQVERIWREAGAALRAVPCGVEGGPVELDPPSPGHGDLGGNPYSPRDPNAACDPDALVVEARQAGGANQWSKMLQKAEASIKCKSSKQARQLALMAACRLGDKTKAQKYWHEFVNNTGMRQICTNTIGE